MPTMVTDRPLTDKDLLNLCDIRPGLRVQRWNKGEKLCVETIASYPFFEHQSEEESKCRFHDPNTMWVKIKSPHYLPFVDRRSLADMGIVPYRNGLWNSTNFTTKAEDLPPVSFRDVTNSADFFAKLQRWLNKMEHDSLYKNEASVTVQVPRHLRNIVREHEFTQKVPYGSIGHDVLVNIVHA